MEHYQMQSHFATHLQHQTSLMEVADSISSLDYQFFVSVVPSTIANLTLFFYIGAFNSFITIIHYYGRIHKWRPVNYSPPCEQSLFYLFPSYTEK